MPPDGLTWVSTSVSLRVCSADWLSRLVPISSMAAVWVCTAVLFISSIPERTFSWMKFSSCEENRQQTLRILQRMFDPQSHSGATHNLRCNALYSQLDAMWKEQPSLFHLGLSDSEMEPMQFHLPGVVAVYSSIHLQVYLGQIEAPISIKLWVAALCNQSRAQRKIQAKTITCCSNNINRMASIMLQ